MKKHAIALLGLSLLTMVLLTAVVVAAQARVVIEDDTPQTTQAENVDAETTAALDQIFANIDYPWPPTGKHSVPPVLLNRLPTDFGETPSFKKRRELFLRALLPIVLIENQRLHEQRTLAKWLLDNPLPAKSSPFYHWLKKLAIQLRVRGDLDKPKVRKRILMRLDEIPPALALAQAAIESGWGTSRFALQGNSLFGQWTFVKSDGLMPENRDSEATHLVASFTSLRESVRAYMRNLNTSNAYHEFRSARALFRAQGKPLRADELASHMHRYSQRGEDYTSEVQRIIRSPALTVLAEAGLGFHTLAADDDDTNSEG